MTINVKVSLCLAKYHAVKTFLCLINHHVMKRYWVSGCIAPHILNLGTRWE